MSEKNNDIEFLRAVAIIFTLIVHLGTLLIFPVAPFVWLRDRFELSMGVDLFFAISGYVITRSLQELLRRENASRLSLIMAFWTRRFFRLFPAAAFWLLVIALYLAQLGVLKENAISLIVPIFNVFNIYNAYCIANQSSEWCGHLFVHGHYWSLSLEEQFYLVYPLFFFFLPRRWLLPLLIVAIAIQLNWWRSVWTYAWFLRTDAILWGAVLASLPRSLICPEVLRSARWSKSVLRVTGIVLIIALPLVARSVTGFGADAKSYGVGLTALICAMLVWVASYDLNLFAVGTRFRQVMMYIGSRSYSIYLAHFVIYNMVNHYARMFAEHFESQWLNDIYFNALVVTVGLVLTFIASEFTYRVVESGLRDKGRYFARKILSQRAAAPVGDGDRRTLDAPEKPSLSP